MHVMNFYNIIHGNDIDGKKMEGIGYVAILLFILFILCGILVMLLEINFFQISKHENVFLYFFYFPVIVIIISQMNYCSLSWFYVSYFVDVNKGDDNYGINLMGFLFFILMSVYCMKIRIYGVFLFFVCLVVKLLRPNIGIIFVIVLSVVSDFVGDGVVQGLVKKLVVLVYIYVFLEQNLGENRWVNLIYLFSGLICVVIVSLCRIEEPEVNMNKIEMNKLLIRYVKQLDHCAPRTLCRKRKILVNFVFQKMLEKCEQKQLFEQNIQNMRKGINDVTYDQLIKIIDYKLKMDLNENLDEIQLKKLLYIFRIQNEYKINETIKKISYELSDENGQDRYSWRSIYFRKYLQIQIFQEFLYKYGNDVFKIKYLLEASFKQQKFIVKSMVLYSHLMNFWNKINNGILVQETIENVLGLVLRQIQELKELYNDLIGVYNALWQYEILRIFMRLIEPSNMDVNQVLGQIKVGENNREIMLIIFVVRNGVVVESSSSFEKMIRVSGSWICNQGLDKIVPRDVCRIVESKQVEIIEKGSFCTIIPFISQDSNISVHYVQIKLLPKPNLAMEYLFIVHPYQKIENEAFLYVNMRTLKIEYVSEQFNRIFRLRQQYLWNKIENQQFYLNDIVTNYEPIEISNNLQNSKNMNCNINLRRFMDKNSNYYFHGNMNMIQRYDDNMIVSLILIDNGENNQERRLSYLQKKGTHMNWAAVSLDKRCQMFKMVSFIDEENKVGENMNQNQEIQKVEKNTRISKSSKSIKNSKQKNEQNLIFCPIGNPFKQKIEQKQIEISTQGTNTIFTYSNCLILSTILLGCLFFVFPFVIIRLTQDQIEETMNAVQSLDTSYFSINYLLYNTFQVYYQYFLCENREYFSRFGELFPHRDTDSTDFTEMLNKMYYQIREFENTTLKNFSRFEQKKNFGQQFELKFRNFTIHANFAHTNLIDYLFNVKLTSQRIKLIYENSLKSNISFEQAQKEYENPLQFLIENYETIANLKSPFMILNTFKNKNISDFEQIIIFMVIGLVIYLGLIFCIWVSICKFIQIRNDIFSILAFTKKNDVVQRFLQLQEISKIYKEEIPEEKLQNIKIIQEQQEKIDGVIMNHAKNKFIKEDQTQQIKSIENNKKIIIYKNKNIKITAFCLIIRLIIVTFFYIIIAFCILNSMLKYKKYQQLFLIYMDELKILKNNEINSSTQMLHFFMLKNVFNENSVMIDVVNFKKSSVDQTIGIGFDEYFYEYYEKQNQILRSDLCANEKGVIAMGYSELLDCRLIGHGILKQGYIQSKQYSDKIKYRIKQGLILPETILQGQIYPAIMIHINIKSRIIQYIDDMVDALKQNHEIQSRKHRQKINFMVVLCFVVFLGYLVYIPVRFFPLVFSIKNISFAYFKMLSNLTFGDIQVSAYIHEKRILQRVLSL